MCIRASGVGLPRGKRCLYDSGTRVPLIVAHPGAEPATSDRVVSFVDLAPTVLSVAGGAPPDWMMGDASTGQHISCTCKMGPASDPMDVVGQYGPVHRIEGLRVVDASIMPDCILANTNVTTMMIGERVAKLIREGS